MASSPTNSKDNVLVYCHDAGGAEIVSAYIKKHAEELNFICRVHGPAEKVFTRKKLKFVPLDDKIVTADSLLDDVPKLGSIIAEPSWQTPFGIDLIEAAKRRGIRTITYLDHWVNHRQQFGYPRPGWEDRLPDEFWVGDEHADKMARVWFPDKAIKLVPNLYFEEIKDACDIKNRSVSQDPKLILFLSEPISSTINSFGDHEDIVFTETEVLESLCEYLAESGSGYRLLIRMHPSEGREKYRSIIDKYSGRLGIEISKDTTLPEDLAPATIVIGMDTMALVLALKCGKRAISLMPDPKRACDLPFQEIIKIKKVAELGQYLF